MRNIYRCMVCVREIHEPEQEKGTIQRPELVPNKGKPDGMKIEEKTAKDNAVAKVAEKTGGKKWV